MRLAGTEQEDRHRHVVERGDEGEQAHRRPAPAGSAAGSRAGMPQAAGAEHPRGLLDGEIDARQARQRRAHDVGHRDDDMCEQEAERGCRAGRSAL